LFSLVIEVDAFGDQKKTVKIESFHSTLNNALVSDHDSIRRRSVL